MTRSRNKLIAAAIVALSFALSACGGEDATAGADVSASHPHERQEQHDQHQRQEQSDNHHEQHGER